MSRVDEIRARWGHDWVCMAPLNAPSLHAVSDVRYLLARLAAAEKVVEAARARCTAAVPGWAPELRAALTSYDAAAKEET